MTERIEENKGLCVKSSEVFVKKGDAAVDATGAALTQSIHAALYETATATKGLLTSNNILRGTADAPQVEVNQLRGEILECQDAKVPT